jgi:hypothetical protein
MTQACRHWRFLGLGMLVAGMLFSIGCNPQAISYLLYCAQDSKFEAKCKLGSEDKKKPSRVVILASMPLETRPDLLGSDRELTTLLSQAVQESCKENKEFILLASTSKVQHFKEQHPNWQSMGLKEIGNTLEADFVVDLEINKLTLYEPGSQNTLFRGKAEISITCVDVHKFGEDPMFHEEYVREYPLSRGPVPVTDIPLAKFRHDFLARMANEISWFFAAHPTEDNYSCD